jgi:hypothetical protein
MNIYRISQDENTGYDTYSDAVVIAPSLKVARHMDPGGDGAPMAADKWARSFSSWASGPENVKVEFIGKAKRGSKLSVVTSSFLAG